GVTDPHASACAVPARRDRRPPTFMRPLHRAHPTAARSAYPECLRSQADRNGQNRADTEYGQCRRPETFGALRLRRTGRTLSLGPSRRSTSEMTSLSVCGPLSRSAASAAASQASNISSAWSIVLSRAMQNLRRRGYLQQGIVTAHEVDRTELFRLPWSHEVAVIPTDQHVRPAQRRR